jgi:tetratricopeptide (TPR) repeat protein
MPDHVYMRSAEVAVDQHRYRDALAALEVLLDRTQPPVGVFTLASLACGKLRDDARAVKLCERGIALHGDAPQLLASQIIPLGRMGQLEQAEAIYGRVCELAPELAEAPFAMGVALMNNGDHERAVALFDQALELDPERAEVYFCLGVLHNQRSEFRAALEDFQRAVELKPDYAEAYYNMKDSFEGLRDFDSSMEMLQKATRLNPAYR